MMDSQSISEDGPIPAIPGETKLATLGSQPNN